MKQVLLGLMALSSLSLVGCIETTYRYNLCDNTNRHWISGLTQGVYEITSSEGKYQKYSVNRGRTPGVYVVMFAEVNSKESFVVQTCTIGGATYLESSVSSDDNDLALFAIKPLNTGAWGLVGLEPNLAEIKKAGIAVYNEVNASPPEASKYIYNSDQQRAAGHNRLTPRMFKISKDMIQDIRLKKIAITR